MSLKICMLASGSKGNCTYLSDDKTSILIDIGLPYKTLAQRAKYNNINLSGISAVITTHCHTDHCCGLLSFTKKHDIPLYSHQKGVEHLAYKTGLDQSRISPFNKDFNIGSLTVTPFMLPHDAPGCCGYSITSGSGKISIATDLGKAQDDVLQSIYGSDIAVMECNHDIQMLIEGRYPPALKKRILSDLGHLSNNQCAAAVRRLIEKGTRKFILAHLSQENNLPELAYNCLTQYLNESCITEGRDYSVTIAYQQKTTHIISI